MLEFSKCTVPVDKKGGLNEVNPHIYKSMMTLEHHNVMKLSNLSRLLLRTIGYISQIFAM